MPLNLSNQDINNNFSDHHHNDNIDNDNNNRMNNIYIIPHKVSIAVSFLYIFFASIFIISTLFVTSFVLICTSLVLFYSIFWVPIQIIYFTINIFFSLYNL